MAAFLISRSPTMEVAPGRAPSAILIPQWSTKILPLSTWATLRKSHGTHSFRAGVDFINLHMNHDEIRQTIFEFTGAGTTAPGQNPNAYNSVADFLLGAVFNESTWVMWDDILTNV